ncbi:MAG: alpha/beta fold hydrolase, partial [Bryobacteraceae bacterium]
MDGPEGMLPVEGGKIWYQIASAGAGIPLLTLHGGPGYPHDYLEMLAALGDQRPVIFYDQLGCGKSDRPADPSLWCAQRFVRELAQLREALGLERFHLLGHSWGSMLAVDYLLAGGTGVERLILASPALSIPRWMEDADRLRRLLP